MNDWLMIVLFAVVIGIMVWALASVWQSRMKKKEKGIWTILIIVTPLLGAVIWYFVR